MFSAGANSRVGCPIAGNNVELNSFVFFYYFSLTHMIIVSNMQAYNGPNS